MRTLLIAAVLTLLAAATAAAEPVLRVDASRPGVKTSAAVTGVDHVFSTEDGKPPANWLATLGTPNPAIVSQATAAGVRLVRFPGGAEANRYDFKAGLGPDRASCQTSGRPGATVPLSNVYGFDEHLRFVDAIGAGAEVMVPFAFQSAQDAADWVEYANSPADGSNPGGGTAWAAVRAANGHPEPYDIRHWEIGNEPDRAGQRYWMSANRNAARVQYARGGVYRAEDEAADGGCVWAAKSTGLPSQVFTTRYAPVRREGFRLTVGEEVWRRVPSLSAPRPDRPVYTLDEQTGEIRFGDLTTGRIPPVGARVYVSYSTPRLPGLDAFRAAMRKVDPRIDVCATWADEKFLRQARAAGRRLDCLAAHPYTLLGRYGSVLYNAAHYDASVKGADEASRAIGRLDRKLRRVPGRPYLVVSEYGALGGRAMTEPGSPGSMIHAIYMATEQLAWARHGLRWAIGGRLTDSVFEIVRGTGERLTPAGELLRVLGEVPGGRLVHAHVAGNPVTHGYPALRAVATRGAGGTLGLLVLNRDRDEPVAARLELKGFTAAGQATLAQAGAAAFDSPDATFEEHRVDAGDGAVVTFPPNSLTRLVFTSP